jgi:hypothetical protein
MRSELAEGSTRARRPGGAVDVEVARVRVLGLQPGAVARGGLICRVEPLGDVAFPALCAGEAVEGGGGFALEGGRREPASLREPELLVLALLGRGRFSR